MCTNFAATRNNPWVKEHFDLDLPAGDYTVAATCDGLLENPVTDDVLVFRGIRNVKVARNDTLTADLAN